MRSATADFPHPHRYATFAPGHGTDALAKQTSCDTSARLRLTHACTAARPNAIRNSNAKEHHAQSQERPRADQALGPCPCHRLHPVRAGKARRRCPPFPLMACVPRLLAETGRASVGPCFDDAASTLTTAAARRPTAGSTPTEAGIISELHRTCRDGQWQVASDRQALGMMVHDLLPHAPVDRRGCE